MGKKEQIITYLVNITGGIFKLLPMKEEAMQGADNHIDDYLDNLIINMKGAEQTYPILFEEIAWLYAINNMQYLKVAQPNIVKWRKIVLNSTKSINQLCERFKEGNNGT